MEQAWFPCFGDCNNGIEYEAPAPRLSNSDHMTPHVLQSVCERLRIPKERFQLTLD